MGYFLKALSKVFQSGLLECPVSLQHRTHYFKSRSRELISKLSVMYGIY